MECTEGWKQIVLFVRPISPLRKLRLSKFWSLSYYSQSYCHWISNMPNPVVTSQTNSIFLFSGRQLYRGFHLSWYVYLIHRGFIFLNNPQNLDPSCFLVLESRIDHFIAKCIHFCIQEKKERGQQHVHRILLSVKSNILSGLKIWKIQQVQKVQATCMSNSASWWNILNNSIP